MSFLLFTSARPFGPLTPVNEYIVTHAQPVSGENWLRCFVVPALPLVLQAYLIQFEGTRRCRMASGLVGLVLMVHATMSYRFEAIYFNAFNNGLGIALFHLLGKYVEFALLEGPIIDPYRAEGRGRIVSTLDLIINSRMVGLGPVGFDEPTVNRKVSGDPASASGPDGAIKLNGAALPADRERWLPYVDKGRTRLQACLRHAIRSYFYLVAFDALLALIEHFGAETIGNPYGHPDPVPTFLSTKPLFLLPRLYPLRLPKVVLEALVELSIASGVWLGISWGYHFLALVSVGSGLWETESWEVDFFDAPWKADSMVDLWGRGWHQLFRHHFLLLSNLILRLFNQPQNSPFLLPLIFCFSGILHVLGEIFMSPVPAPLPIFAFFFLSGLGTAAELMFKRVTGRKVRGWPGRIWAWSIMLLIAKLPIRAWMNAGVCGSSVTPSTGPGRLGHVIARFFARWIVAEA